MTRRNLLFALIVVVAGVGGAAAVVLTRAPSPRTVSAAEDIAMWSDADASLMRFIGTAYKLRAGAADVTQMRAAAVAYASAVGALASVSAPAERRPAHVMVLPLYQQMALVIQDLVDLPVEGGAQALGWTKLAFLADRAASLTASLGSLPGSATAPPTASSTIAPTTPSVPPTESAPPSTSAPTTARPTPVRTAPPTSSTPLVAVLPSSTGPVGSNFLLQLSNFPAGERVSITITGPTGLPRPLLVTTANDGSASVLVDSKLTDSAGKYVVRLDWSGLPITTTITTTR